MPQPTPLIQSIRKILAPYKSLVKKSASGVLKYDYLVPGGPYDEQWDWDAFFMGMALAAEDPNEATYLRNVVLNMLENAQPNGFVPGCITPQGADPRLNQVKPFVAQAAYFASTFLGDFGWIAPHYEILKRVVGYRQKHLWSKKYDLAVWFNSMESGIDDNVAALDFPEMSVIGADCNAYIFREYTALALIAQKLKKSSDARTFSYRAKAMKSNINRYLWNSRDETYYNLFAPQGTHIERIVISNFMPLWAGIASPDQGKRMIRRYLINTNHLWSMYGIRSLSKRDKQYNNVNKIKPHSNWQGPVWPIANYLCMHALLNYGFQKEAVEVAETITRLVLRDIESSGGMHENYDAETGIPLAAPNFISWNLLVGNMLTEAQSSQNPFLLGA